MSELNFELLEKNIRLLLEKEQITQQQLAEIAGMTQANVSKSLNPNEKKHFTLDRCTESHSTLEFLSIGLLETNCQ